MINKFYGDFHIHTFLSDGSSSPEEVFINAKAAKLSHIAITDHDVIPCENQYVCLEEKYNVKNLRAVEISSMDMKRHRRVHILCYLPIITEEIEKICEVTVKNRMNAGLEMAELVSKKYPVSIAEITEIANTSKSIFKQHIMKSLINKGFADKIYGTVYDELFGGGNGSCLIDCIQPDVFDVIAAVKRSGGLCVMAHPHTYKGIEFLKEGLAENIFDGVEIWSGKTNEKQEKELLDIVSGYNVIKTGGTDFHGENAERNHSIGYKKTPENSINKMFEINNERLNKRK